MSIFKKGREKEYTIIGLGQFGASLARRLEALGHSVLGIDIDPRLVKELDDEITEAIILDATDVDALLTRGHQILGPWLQGQRAESPNRPA